MTRNEDEVRAVVDQLTPEAQRVLRRVLEIENEKLYVKARDVTVTDAIVEAVKGLVK